MNINELDKYQLTAAINFNKNLNPALFNKNDKMKEEVREHLLDIADDFREFIGVENLSLVDIILTGSNAAYSYTPHSDIDLHLVVDFSKLPESDVYHELFNAKKFQYNELNDIKIKGYPVELYVQDSEEPHSSLGEYSILHNTWNKIPTKKRANLDDVATKAKYEKLKELSIIALHDDDEDLLNRVLDLIKRYRSAGLAEKGEFGPENLAFKLIREEGLFKKLWDKKRKNTSRDLSLEDNSLVEQFKNEYNGIESTIKNIYESRAEILDIFSLEALYKQAENIKLYEVAYPGNIGMMEVMQFYRVATPEQIKLFNGLVSHGENKKAWQVVQKITGVQLHGKEFTAESHYNLDDNLNQYISGDCPIMAIALHKITGYPIYALLDYDEDIERTVLVHAYVKSPNGTPIDVSGETSIEDMLNEFPNWDAYETKISIKDLISIGYGGKCPTLTEVMPVAKEVVNRLNLTEGVGKIIKGVNTTPDVGVNQTKIEAKKLGFNVTTDGLPPILSTNGKTPDELLKECTDELTEIHLTSLREQFIENTNLLENEDRELITKIDDFINLFKITPIVGNEYVYVSLLITPGVHVNIAYMHEPAKLIDLNYNIATFQLANGSTKRWPENDLEADSILYKSLFLRDVEELNNFRTAFTLKFSNTDIKTKMLESQLNEVKMAPGTLQKEVDKLVDTVNPIIGLELEVCVPRDESPNPDVTKNTTLQDIEDFFEYNSNDDFEPLINDYNEWLMGQSSSYASTQAEESIDNPYEDRQTKLEIMTEDYIPSRDAYDLIEEIKGEDEDSDITVDVAKKILKDAYDATEKYNDPSLWDIDEIRLSPYAQLYYEIFIADNSEAIEKLQEVYQRLFWEQDPYQDKDYSFGAFCLFENLTNMYDVYSNWSSVLHWTGASVSDYDFDEMLASQIASDIEDSGFDVVVSPDSGKADYSSWSIVSDETIHPAKGDTGFELISPKLPYEEGIDQVEYIISVLDSYNAYTNDSCGLHINVSLENVEHSQLDYVKLILLLGDKHILKKFGREFNEYAMDSVAQLKELLDQTPGFSMHSTDTYLSALAHMRESLHKVLHRDFERIYFGKFASVNIKPDRIEFRSPGGANYLGNLDLIIDTINRFVYAYSIACDPNAYRKEYGKKLYKLASSVSSVEDKSAISLFAKFNSGLISKEKLMNILRDRNIPSKDNVDMGEPILTKDTVLDSLKRKYKIDDDYAGYIWQYSLEKESEHTPNRKEAIENTFENLMRDINYYRKDV